MKLGRRLGTLLKKRRAAGPAIRTGSPAKPS
jgi:hypothetical protein